MPRTAARNSRTDRRRRRDTEDTSAAASAPIDKSLTDLFAELEKGDINSTQAPSVKMVEWFHRNASKDRDTDIHHQIGIDPGNVARGNHNHDGKTSPTLWEAASIPADPAATTAALATWAAVINDLLELKSG